MIHREDHPMDNGNSIAILRLENGKANAVDLELFEELETRLDELESSAARAVVITGTGTMFSAGVDIPRILDGGEAYIEQFVPKIGVVVRKLYGFPLPVVAAIGGHAIAGGCVLASACDLRLMAEGDGKIGVTELEVGVPFPVAALEAFRALLPEHRAYSLVMSGRLLGARKARKFGLIDEIVPPEDLLERALGRARELAAIPSGSFALTKRQLRGPVLERIDRLTAELEDEVLALWKSPEVLASMRTFFEKVVGQRR